MNSETPPYQTTFFFFCSIVAAIVAIEAGLFDHSNSYAENQSYEVFSDNYDTYLENNKVHPWCGFEQMDNVEIGYLVPDGDSGVRFINEDEYKN